MTFVMQYRYQCPSCGEGTHVRAVITGPLTTLYDSTGQMLGQACHGHSSVKGAPAAARRAGPASSPC